MVMLLHIKLLLLFLCSVCALTSMPQNDPTHDATTSPSCDIQYLSLTVTNESDQDMVWQMLLHAAHEMNIDEVKRNPLLTPYAQRFGSQEGDMGVVAKTKNNAVVGAAWVRFLPDVGFATVHLADDDAEFKLVKALPELALACIPDYRGQGIGTKLLNLLLQAVKEAGQYPGVCLSCRMDNAAIRLYERVGFKPVKGSKLTNRAGGSSITMKCTFADHPQENNG